MPPHNDVRGGYCIGFGSGELAATRGGVVEGPCVCTADGAKLVATGNELGKGRHAETGVDSIRWKYEKFDRTKINGWVDIARYLMPQGPYTINSPE